MKRFSCVCVAGLLALALSGPAYAQDDSGVALGIKGMLLPVGTLYAEASGGLLMWAGDTDAALAGGVSPFVDFVVNPYISLGLGPEFIFNVNAKDSESDAGTMINVNARAKLSIPASEQFSLYALVTPGWSIILLPSDLKDASGMDDPSGFEIGAAGGAQINFTESAGAFIEIGYQWGFQNSSRSIGIASVDFTGVNYLMINLGVSFML